MEDNCSDKVDVLETTEALLARNVPQSNRLVHGRGQDKVVLQIFIEFYGRLSSSLQQVNKSREDIVCTS